VEQEVPHEIELAILSIIWALAIGSRVTPLLAKLARGAQP